jgi:hypothetical protein
MRAIYLLVLLAACSTCLIGIPSRSRELDKPLREQRADPKPALVRQADLEVMDVVLNDMLKERLFYPIPGPVGDRKTIVDSMTEGSITDNLISRHFGDKDRRRIPSDVREDLVRRNPKLPMSLEHFKPLNPLIVVSDLSPSERAGGFLRAHGAARGWVKFWAPGYSSDGVATVVIFSCGGFGRHSQVCAVGLARKDGAWKVSWRRSTYYI